MNMEVIRKAVKEYNKYRAPESVAKILKIEDNRITIAFSGSFCETCGVYDWIEDLKYEFENFNIDADLMEIIEKKGTKNQRIAIFKLNKITPKH